MRIRKASIKDFESILKLQIQLDEEEIKYDTNLKTNQCMIDEGIEALKKRIRKRNNIFFVALDEEDEIVGFIDGMLWEDAWYYNEKVAYLGHICVDKKYRNKGYATMLLNEFEKIVKEKGAKHIRLLAFHENMSAVTFYKKNGFLEYSTYYNKKL